MMNRRRVRAAALLLWGGCLLTACRDQEDASPSLPEGEVSLGVAFEGPTRASGRLIGWNIGRGTMYVGAGDTLHPEWRTPERVAAADLLRKLNQGDGALAPPPYTPRMRFSGLQIDGSMGADGYHFAPLVAPDRGVDPNDNMAVFQYMALIEESGALPLVTLNFGSGTANEAGRYATYLNGDDSEDPLVAARQFWGPSQPYGVAIFEIGNESYGFWNTGARADGGYSYANPLALNGGDPGWVGRPSSDAADFAARAQEYMDVVRQHAPGARFWVPLTQASMDAWGGALEAVETMRSLLERPELDAVVVHQYAAEDARVMGWTAPNDPLFLLTSSAWFEPGFQALRGKLSTLARSEPLKMAITEYHLAGFFSGGFPYTESPLVGLGLADMMMGYARWGIEELCQHMAIDFPTEERPNVEPLFSAWYNPFRLNNGVVGPAPSYEITDLLADHWLPRMAEVDARRMTQLSVSDGVTSYEAPTVASVAFVAEDGALGSILLLNRDLERSAATTLDLPNDRWRVREEARAYAPSNLTEDFREQSVARMLAEPPRQSGQRVAVDLPPHSLVALRFDLEQ